MKAISLISAIVFLFFTVQANAQASLKCLQLEGFNIGCTPATNHPCFRTVAKNVEEIGEPDPGKTPASCFYVEKIFSNLRQDDGPLPMDCIGTRPNPDCDPKENPNCTTSICDKYSIPTCKEVCKECAEEQKTFDTFMRNAGCVILSDGSGGCEGPACRKRCGDEPYAGGIEYEGCNYGGGCGRPEGTPFVACKYPAPICPATHPNNSNFKLVKSRMDVCSTLQGCPKAIDYRGNGIAWPPPGVTGDPNDYCLQDNGSVVPRGPAPDRFCPLGSRPITGVLTSKDTCPTDIPIVSPPQPDPVTCPWVKAFGAVRTNCEAVPECCQFNPVTRTSPAAGAEGRCPVAANGKDSCTLWLEQHPKAAAGSSMMSTPVINLKTNEIMSPLKGK